MITVAKIKMFANQVRDLNHSTPNEWLPAIYFLQDFGRMILLTVWVIFCLVAANVFIARCL